MFTEKDISDLSTDFSRRTEANGKIHFGMRRAKGIKALLHWVKYFYRISIYPTIFEINEVMFIEQFDIDMHRSEIRNKRIYQYNKKAKKYSLGPLDSENKWKERE